MSKTFTIANSDSMNKYISKVLGEVDLGVQEAINETIDKIGKTGSKKVRELSPKKSGKYAKGWRYNATKRQPDGSFSAVIHNAKYGWLVHLLEFGHPVFGKDAQGNTIVKKDPTKKNDHVEKTQEWINTEGLQMLINEINQQIMNIKT